MYARRFSAKVSLKPIFASVLLLMLQACEGPSRSAPSDSDMIKTFQANRIDFEYWKEQFNQPNQNCRVERIGESIHVDGAPCIVSDKNSLLSFMKKTGVTSIEARLLSRHSTKDGPIIFSVFAEGTSLAGRGKQFAYDPDYHGPLEKNLDVYDWRFVNTLPGKPRPCCHWLRRVTSGWYLFYDAN